MKRKIMLLTVIFWLFAVLIPLTVYADANEDAVDFQITINTDGSADFIETHTVAFSGGQDYTRYGRIYLYPRERTMDGWSVTVDGDEWEKLSAPDNDKRPDGNYAVEYNGEGAVVTMYHRSTDMQRTFTISYHVQNAVNLYNDAAEFFWNLTSDNEISTVKRLTARVIVPGGMSEEDFRIWAHGPLNGVFQKDNANTANLSVSYVTASDPVDIRIVMPPELFLGGNVIRENILENILGEEKELADKANAEREEAERYWAEWEREREEWRKAHPVRAWIEDTGDEISSIIDNEFSAYIFMISIFGTIPFAILRSFINNKRSAKMKENMRQKPADPPQYYRSLPDRRPPALAGRLAEYYSGGNAGNLFTSTLMDMTLKGYLEMRNVGRDIVLTPIKSEESLLEHEQIISEMIESARGKDPSVTLRNFRSYIKRYAEWAISMRNRFNASVEELLDDEIKTTLILSEKRPKQNGIILLISSLIGFATLSIPLSGLEYDSDYSPLLASMLISLIIGFVWGIILIITKYSYNFKLLSQKDEESMALWQAFGRFINDFTTFDKKDLPEFSVWKEYLVYAVALGKGQKLIRDLAIRYPDLSEIEDGTYFSCLLMNGRFDDKLFTSINDIQKATYSASVSSNSSGGGGGFSSSGGGSNSGSGGGFAD